VIQLVKRNTIRQLVTSHYGESSGPRSCGGWDFSPPLSKHGVLKASLNCDQAETVVVVSARAVITGCHKENGSSLSIHVGYLVLKLPLVLLKETESVTTTIFLFEIHKHNANTQKK
jgi:hypothetical protein